MVKTAALVNHSQGNLQLRSPLTTPSAQLLNKGTARGCQGANGNYSYLPFARSPQEAKCHMLNQSWLPHANISDSKNSVSRIGKRLRPE